MDLSRVGWPRGAPGQHIEMGTERDGHRKLGLAEVGLGRAGRGRDSALKPLSAPPTAPHPPVNPLGLPHPTLMMVMSSVCSSARSSRSSHSARKARAQQGEFKSTQPRKAAPVPVSLQARRRPSEGRDGAQIHAGEQ